jgi:hypothetical protein
MADDQIENGQETEEAKPLTLFEEKMKSLLDELAELLEQVGGDYGPILMEELQNRLELIVKNFNDEVHTLFTESFKKWKVTDSQMREFVKADVKVPKPKKAQKKPKKASTPEFIKNVEFGPVRPK